jgi:hypothetical protein
MVCNLWGFEGIAAVLTGRGLAGHEQNSRVNSHVLVGSCFIFLVGILTGQARGTQALLGFLI